MTEPKSFVKRVRDQLEQLSPTERRLADFTLDFPGDLAGYTASELAALTHVSNATVTRFVRRLGYNSYDHARKHIRSEREAGSPLLLAEVKHSTTDEGLQAQLQQAIRNLNQSFNRWSPELLGQLAKQMLEARKLWLIGYRSNHALATYLRWQLLQIAPHAQVIPGPGETLAEHFAGLGAEDMVIVFALRRRVQRTHQLVTQAAKQQAKVLFITDQHNHNHPQATWSMRCDVQSPGVLDNHVSVIALCHLLATYTMQAAGAAGRRHLGSVEAQHDVFNELEEPPQG
ncbi:MAG TPA: MurR/RpiR family transcriptional regulator [Candidatus Paenalcaligenes intestinipullorum]|uniref:MurR/RpiR family transcriptional regulator n=1 Tax=Candidatus Paenalcaligenes intestinipullorum TaxID=2838718 RepID=A0A9D2RKI2_9BURK|nr:MurR/RpiR family transcriptional regulator [Candidatus Paenalcaligenes intestinipullorum]